MINSNNPLQITIVAGTSTAFVQGGNAFGAAAVLGTNDNYNVEIKRNGVNQIVLTNTYVSIKDGHYFTDTSYYVTDYAGSQIVLDSTTNSISVTSPSSTSYVKADDVNLCNSSFLTNILGTTINTALLVNTSATFNNQLNISGATLSTTLNYSNTGGTPTTPATPAGYVNIGVAGALKYIPYYT